MADLTVADLLPDGADDAGALIADDVRPRRHLAPRTMERIAALDADRADVDDDAARVAEGVGHVLSCADPHPRVGAERQAGACAPSDVVQLVAHPAPGVRPHVHARRAIRERGADKWKRSFRSTHPTRIRLDM